MPANGSNEKEATAVLVETDKADDKNKNSKDKKNGKDDKNKPEELSEEDQALKEGLELAVTRLRESDESLHKQALDHLINEIRTATSSMTSVPKPLKFLRPHYDALKAVYDSWPLLHTMKKQMADVMSVLAMTMAPAGSRESLQYRLKGTKTNLSSWGHEYLRTLSGEISEEYNVRLDNADDNEEAQLDDLLLLVDDIMPFQMKHNAEAEAIDLLMEVKQLNKLIESDVIDERNYERVCLYLIRSASFVMDPEDLDTLYETAYAIYKAQRKYTSALRVALKMDSSEYVSELFGEELGASKEVKQQMGFILARHRSHFVVEDDEALNEIIGNCGLSERFLAAARELDVLTPKSPDDIYKIHLVDSSAVARANRNAAAGNVPVDSARANLAATFTNAFVNAGYCKDKLIIDEDNSWLFKNKGHGMMSAAASLGMLMMWNVDEGLNQIDKYFHNSEDFVKAGACLGVGIVSCGVRNEADPALALLSDYLENTSTNIRTASISGLGIAYAGAQREEVKELLEVIVGNTETGNITEASMAALSLGLCFVGTCNDDIGSVILQRLMETTDVDMAHTSARFMCLGLGLIYLGKGEAADAVLEALRTIEHKRGKYAEVTLESCAYAGTGNVLKVQEMLRLCTEHLTEEAEHQAVAVLGIALITTGEEIGMEMTLRTFEHLLHYGEMPIKRVVPLALALLYISNPEYAIIDQLSRLSHDQDHETAQCAIMGLGLISAGTNNSRVAGLLRSLAEFYAKEANHLFIVRISQGLNAMGKGLMGLSPFHSDRLLLNGPGLGGLLTLLHACIDIKGTILDKYHYLLFFLAPSMNTRYLATVDTDLAAVSISVRVGLAVETVGQAGRPKTITGFQTHTTPVLLGYKDRAELAGNEYTSVSSVLEGVVIVEKVPEEIVQAQQAQAAATQMEL